MLNIYFGLSQSGDKAYSILERYFGFWEQWKYLQLMNRTLINILFKMKL